MAMMKVSLTPVSVNGRAPDYEMIRPFYSTCPRLSFFVPITGLLAEGFVQF